MEWHDVLQAGGWETITHSPKIDRHGSPDVAFFWTTMYNNYRAALFTIHTVLSFIDYLYPHQTVSRLCFQASKSVLSCSALSSMLIVYAGIHAVITKIGLASVIVFNPAPTNSDMSMSSLLRFIAKNRQRW